MFQEHETLFELETTKKKSTNIKINPSPTTEYATSKELREVYQIKVELVVDDMDDAYEKGVK